MSTRVKTDQCSMSIKSLMSESVSEDSTKNANF